MGGLFISMMTQCRFKFVRGLLTLLTSGRGINLSISNEENELVFCLILRSDFYELGFPLKSNLNPLMENHVHRDSLLPMKRICSHCLS